MSHKAPLPIGAPVWLNPDFDLGLNKRIAYIVQGVRKNCIGLWNADVVPENDLTANPIGIAIKYLLSEPPPEMLPAPHQPGELHQTRTGTYLKLIIHPLARPA